MLTNQQVHGKMRLLNFQHVVFGKENTMIERFERFSYAIFEVSRRWHKIAAASTMSTGRFSTEPWS
jgi:hypothetical protein